MSLKKIDDLLKKENDRQSFNPDKPLTEGHSLNGVKQHVKFGTKSTDGKCDITFERKDNQDASRKQNMKFNMNHGDCKTSFMADQDVLQSEGTGMAYNEDSNKVHIGAMHKFNHKAETHALGAHVHFDGKFTDTMKAFLFSEIAANFNKENKFENAVSTNQWMIQDGDIQAGVKFAYDI